MSSTTRCTSLVGNGTKADWFRNALANSNVTVRIATKPEPVWRARSLIDDAERRSVGELMGAKYPWNGDAVDRSHLRGVVFRRAATRDLRLVHGMTRPRTPPKPGTMFEAIGVRGAIVGVLALSIAIALVTCRPEATAPTDTVGVVPEQTTTTLDRVRPRHRPARSDR